MGEGGGGNGRRRGRLVLSGMVGADNGRWGVEKCCLKTTHRQQRAGGRRGEKGGIGHGGGEVKRRDRNGTGTTFCIIMGFGIRVHKNLFE